MINTAQIRSLLRPGLNEVFGTYDMFDAEWSKLYTTHTAKYGTEYDVEMKFLGAAQLKAEGASTAYDTMAQRYTTAYNTQYVSLGFIITRKAIKDNQYESRFPMQTRALRDAFMLRKESLGAATFNNAFDTAFPIGDGSVLCATGHAIDTGTVANRATAHADLNETSLENSLIDIGGFLDVAGNRRRFIAQSLLVARQGQFVADRLLYTKGRVDTANNDLNAINHMNMLPKGFFVNHYLTDPDAWFVLTNAPQGFKYFIREPFESDMYTDFDNQNLKVLGIERYAFGVSNFRAVWGSAGA